MRYPTISIVTCSYNSPVWLWKKTLHAISMQQFPVSQIEHIIMDGGSTNGTIELLKRYHTKVVVRKDLLFKPVMRMGLGIAQARGDVVLFLEPDNIMIGRTWLRDMVKPFMDHKDIVGSFSMYNGYESNMPMFTKYCALFGINDPIVYYLGKSEKIPHFLRTYDKGNILYTDNTYTKVQFTRGTLPTLGDNGHMVRRELIMKVNRDPSSFLHTDAFALLAGMGFRTYGVVHNSIIHYTGSSVLDFCRRRIEYKRRYYDDKKNKRAYLVYNPYSFRDKKNLILFILYSLTIVQPLMLSIRGFLSKPESAWFLHPITCFSMVVGYGYSEIQSRISTVRK